ncbi:MAG: hypothetical protein EOM91_12970 [Sphingobacteriia bacterium]|nr:hypothetical protein [Sphingobacteriia bacterium]
MVEVTVVQLASTVGIPVERLLTQLAEAGIGARNSDATLTEQEKLQLLGYLRRSHGKGHDEGIDAPVSPESESDAIHDSVVPDDEVLVERPDDAVAPLSLLAERTAELDRRETELEARWQDFSLGKAAVVERERALVARENVLEERTRELEQREIEADSGFMQKNREALSALASSHATLRDELTQVQAQIDSARLDGIRALEQRLVDERRIRLESLDTEIETLRERARLDLASERERIAHERKEHEKAIAEDRERLAADRRSFGDTQADLSRREGELRWREEEIEGMRAGIGHSIEERARDRVSEMSRQLERLRDDKDRIREERDEIQSILDSKEELLSRFGNPEEVLRGIKDGAKKIKALEKELLARPSASDKERLVELQEQERSWASERESLIHEIVTLRAERGRWHIGVQELETLREEKEILKRRNEVMSKEMDKYAEEVERMRSLYEPSAERDVRVGPIEHPWRTDFKIAPERKDLTEIEWLDRIVADCEASGMRFPRRLLLAFHTSLKSAELSPLTVLSGVSGTGKSELPRLYSRFGGLAFLSLAVQPNWDSPQSLFGFFNSVDNRFNATTVLRAMVQAQHAPDHETYRNGLADRLLIVLLDEMNLAHVEQYFSDLLSRLEQRRGESSDIALDIDLGAGMPPYPLRLGRNVMWVGTMNEDETTKALSDKVIDRSNLLHFPRPRTLHSRAEVALAPEAPLISKDTWNGWLQRRLRFAAEEVDPFRNALEEINGHLEHVGRALGHRVWQAVEYYMGSYPEVIAAGDDREVRARAMRSAFEDQLVLKVMSKLRGIETSGDAKRNCLDPIRKQIEAAELGLGLAEDFDIACRVGYGAFVWNSARYLERAE